MNKDLVEKTRQTLLAIDRMVQEINGYLVQLRRQADSEIAELQRRTGTITGERPSIGFNVAPKAGGSSWPPTTTEDTRDPYLSGRQPRRDGDSYGSVAASTRGGEDGEKGKDIRKR